MRLRACDGENVWDQGVDGGGLEQILDLDVLARCVGEFFEARRDIYNLYPLLVHTALFGGHYAGSVAAILARYG